MGKINTILDPTQEGIVKLREFFIRELAWVVEEVHSTYPDLPADFGQMLKENSYNIRQQVSNQIKRLSYY
jgi:hypothetical protein